MRIAIYDLDKTLTRRATYTPFLHFAARRLAPWRLAFSPVWIAAMVAYRAGLCSRGALKRFGMRLMLGDVALPHLEAVGAEFARRRIAAPGLIPATMRLLEEDRASGARIVIATAAFDFYAKAFAEGLEIDDIVASVWEGGEIVGGNCYGEVKRARVVEWLEREGLEREDLTIRFVSDSAADAPLLDLADEPVLITASAGSAATARARGWRVIDPSG